MQDESSLDSRLCCWATANTERMDVCTVPSKGIGSVSTMKDMKPREDKGQAVEHLTGSGLQYLSLAQWDG